MKNQQHFQLFKKLKIEALQKLIKEHKNNKEIVKHLKKQLQELKDLR